jgi:hypothetical protein
MPSAWAVGAGDGVTLEGTGVGVGAATGGAVTVTGGAVTVVTTGGAEGSATGGLEGAAAAVGGVVRCGDKAQIDTAITVPQTRKIAAMAHAVAHRCRWACGSGSSCDHASSTSWVASLTTMSVPSLAGPAWVSGAYSVSVYCFGGDKLLRQHGTFAEQQGPVAAGGQVTFSANLYGATCPTFAVGVDGWFAYGIKRYSSTRSARAG